MSFKKAAENFSGLLFYMITMILYQIEIIELFFAKRL